ncbi:MAG: hypothetical protein KDD82_21970 [Planctomycetes bacterium]|nr:hypothetical protein [Planctomycetota bacterium]
MSGCEETAGFLFKHRCGREAQTECLQCGKPICLKHVKSPGGQEHCVHCTRDKLGAKIRPPAPRRSRARGRDDDFDGDFDDDFGDDPYFYAYAYYEGYGSYGRGEWGHAHARDLDDPVDFTEADGEAFAVERDTDFEHDMGAS